MIADHYVAWYPRLLSRARGLLAGQGSDDAEDLVSQAVERALRAEQRGQAVEYGYLYRTLGTLAIDRARTRRIEPVSAEQLDLNPAPDRTEAEVVRRQYAEWLLAQLTPRQANVLRQVGRGWIYLEVAEQLGCTENVVKQLVKRGRARAREVAA